MTYNQWNALPELSLRNSSQTQYFKDLFKVWSSTYETSFDNYGLSSTHSITPPKFSEGWFMAFHQCTQQCHERFEICNYGLTTTQQQAHNRTSAGLSNKFSITNNNSNFSQTHTKTC